MFAGSAISAVVYGVVAWKEGEAQKYYPYSTDIVQRATHIALKDMGLSDEVEKTEADSPPKRRWGSRRQKVEVKESLDIKAGGKNKFKIKVEEVDKNITRLSVRVNFMGDKPYAELFYKKVDDNIGVIVFKK
jgi:hypothetical protein